MTERQRQMKTGRASITYPVGALLVAGLITTSTAPRAAEGVRYEPNWESLDKRPIPEWFEKARFGVFVVWGPYAVPAWKDRGYAEWYGNEMRREGSPTQKFHERVYGKDFRYEQFAERFTAEMWDPDFWADLFVRAGAKYVVTTANYHDGFCLWPSPYSKGWNAMDVGPKRDLLGELNEAGRKRGLKMGIYYSLYEWRHPLWLTDRDRYVTEHLHPQFKDVVTRHKPPIILRESARKKRLDEVHGLVYFVIWRSIGERRARVHDHRQSPRRRKTRPHAARLGGGGAVPLSDHGALSPRPFHRLEASVPSQAGRARRDAQGGPVDVLPNQRRGHVRPGRARHRLGSPVSPKRPPGSRRRASTSADPARGIVQAAESKQGWMRDVPEETPDAMVRRGTGEDNA